MHFLDSHGNWPLCRTTKCKKQNKYAVYSEFSNKKPAYCGGCRPNDMVHAHYTNLKVYLQSKGMLEEYKVDATDENACKVFAVQHSMKKMSSDSEDTQN